MFICLRPPLGFCSESGQINSCRIWYQTQVWNDLRNLCTIPSKGLRWPKKSNCLYCLISKAVCNQWLWYKGTIVTRYISAYTLQRQNAEYLKQIFPEKEYQGLSPNFYIHVSVSELYISTMGLPFLLEEICGPILGIYKSLTDTWMWKLGLRPRYSQKRNI